MLKQPKQRRAQVTVDAIIEAGFICVAKHGVAGTTTRHIADVAGCGVGTLYEYFANKEQIFEMMNQRFLKDVIELIEAVTPHIVPMQVEDGALMLMQHFGELLTRNQDRYLKVAKEVLHADMDEYLNPIRDVLSKLVIQYLMHHPEYTRLPQLQTMSYIFINAGILLVLNHLSMKNPPISYEELTGGLAEMIKQYVKHAFD